MLTPVTSLGSRSGVNWMRRTVAAIDAANALASIVFPTPGTSSRSRCPSASSTTSAVRTTSDLPSMTVSTAARIASATEATASTSGRVAGSGRGTRESAGSVAIGNLPAGAGAVLVCARERARDERNPPSAQPMAGQRRFPNFPDIRKSLFRNLCPRGFYKPVPVASGARRSLRLFVETFLKGVAGQLHPVVQLQLVQRVLDVVLHRAVADRQPRGDLFARQTGGHQSQHLGLPLGEARRGVGQTGGSAREPPVFAQDQAGEAGRENGLAACGAGDGVAELGRGRRLDQVIGRTRLHRLEDVVAF